MAIIGSIQGINFIWSDSRSHKKLNESYNGIASTCSAEKGLGSATCSNPPPSWQDYPPQVTVMPYVEIAQGNSDFASLWYITNSPTGHVSSFNPDKPTIILLHPFFLDSTWLDPQFGDPRFTDDYNLIAFDQRAAGRTLSRPNGKQDSWTDAADLAFACHVRVVSLLVFMEANLVALKRRCVCRPRTSGRARRRVRIWAFALLRCTCASFFPACRAPQTIENSRLYRSGSPIWC